MFEKLKYDILQCRDCHDKFGFEPHPIVFGNENSKIVQISQAPSNNVHITMKPFNDQSGRKLRNEFYQIDDDVFYNMDNFYITAIAHCYPGKSINGGDRLPPIACARKWLSKEIEIVNNELYIIIGSKACSYFFPKQNYTELIFKDNILNKIPALILPHPSPLNSKWFKDHPKFINSRLPEIRNTIHKVLEI